MVILTFIYFIVEIVVGNITNSVALVTDALHMLSDVVSLLIALFAVRIAKRRSDINTYGWVRGEVVGANINTVFLLALCLTIVFDIIKRYITPEPIVDVNLLLIVGSTGLGINIIGLFLFQGFHGHSHGGGGAHGHSHHASKDTSKDKKKNTAGDKKNTAEVDRRAKAQTINNDTTITDDHDDESFENVTGSTNFQRHSTRALQEVISNCVNEAHSHSHDHHSHGHSHEYLSSSERTGRTESNTDRKKKKASSMNMHGVFLHVLADALGSVVVIISALLIKFVPHDPNNHKHWTVYIDPTLSAIIIIVITISTVPLFKETTFILLQTMPKHIEVESLKKELLEEVPEVNGIHELHIWRLTGEKIIASAHLHRQSLFDYMPVADKVKSFFHSKGIHSTTMQYEYNDNDKQPVLESNDSDRSEPKVPRVCLLRCTDDACDTQACCTNKTIRSDTMLTANDDAERPRPAADAEIRIELENEQQQRHSCGDSGHSHNHVSVDDFNHDEKF